MCLVCQVVVLDSGSCWSKLREKLFLPGAVRRGTYCTMQWPEWMYLSKCQKCVKEDPPVFRKVDIRCRSEPFSLLKGGSGSLVSNSMAPFRHEGGAHHTHTNSSVRFHDWPVMFLSFVRDDESRISIVKIRSLHRQIVVRFPTRKLD